MLIDEGGSVVDEVLIGTTPDDWIGDERLAYRVICESQNLTVVPSDFAQYGVGNVVLIQKGGIKTVTNLKGQKEVHYGCQDPAKGTELVQLSNHTVRQFHNDGFIVPQRFWELGG